ncbi:MAG: prephenate dehydratase [Gemmatimonadales bacterium]|nr:MAG: prephenate dehydratase [Gemmatimonadales bacterium]
MWKPMCEPVTPTPGSRLPRVAFQGAPGAFSEEAILTHHRTVPVVPLPCRDFRELVLTVAGGGADQGMIPVENSLAGTVAAAYDALLDTPVEIRAEVILPIRHHLMAVPWAKLEGIREVFSHSVALAQCNRFFQAHPDVRPVVAYDTAGAAREVAERKDSSVAAVAPEAAAARYGLTILARGIEDRSDNQTRFYLISRPDAPAGPRAPETSAGRKTVLMVEMPDQVGSLHAALGPFAREGLTLSKVESRPAPRPWTYRFILEVRAGMESPAMRRAVDELRADATSVRLLGSFPAAAHSPPGRD